MKVLSFSRAVNQLIMRVHTPKVEYKLALQEKLKKKNAYNIGSKIILSSSSETLEWATCGASSGKIT